MLGENVLVKKFLICPFNVQQFRRASYKAFGYETCARLGFKSQVVVRVYARVSAMHMAIGDTGGRGLGQAGHRPRPRSRARLGWSRSHTESWEADQEPAQANVGSVPRKGIFERARVRHHCPDVKLETGENVQERFWPSSWSFTISTGQKISGKRFSISGEKGSFFTRRAQLIVPALQIQFMQPFISFSSFCSSFRRRNPARDSTLSFSFANSLCVKRQLFVHQA